MFLSPELLFAVSSVPDSRRWLPLAAERSARARPAGTGHGEGPARAAPGAAETPGEDLLVLEKTHLAD